MSACAGRTVRYRSLTALWPATWTRVQPWAVQRDAASNRSKADIVLPGQLLRGSLSTEARVAADHRHLRERSIRLGRKAGVLTARSNGVFAARGYQFASAGRL